MGKEEIKPTIFTFKSRFIHFQAGRGANWILKRLDNVWVQHLRSYLKKQKGIYWRKDNPDLNSQIFQMVEQSDSPTVSYISCLLIKKKHYMKLQLIKKKKLSLSIVSTSCLTSSNWHELSLHPSLWHQNKIKDQEFLGKYHCVLYWPTFYWNTENST